MVSLLPDDFVHARVGEEWLIKFIVAPLSVAEQVYYHIPAELALVLNCQSCGTDNFLRIVPIDMDNCTSHNFTCPGIQNKVKGSHIQLPSKENGHKHTQQKTTGTGAQHT